MDLTTLDLNALPVWLIAVSIALYLLPKVLENLSKFIPPLATLMEAERQRKDTALHWKLENNGLRLATDMKAQERLIDILEQSLERMFDDRAGSEANYQQVSAELKELRYQVQRMASTLSLLGGQIAKLTDEVEEHIAPNDYERRRPAPGDPGAAPGQHTRAVPAD